MRHLPLFLLSALVLLPSCKDHKAATAGPEAGIPTDSIYCRDPFIVADPATRTYYLYRSSTTPEGLGGVEAFTSKDLKYWKGPERVFTVPEDNFITGSVWAPEVHGYKGSWYLFATLNSDRRWAESVENWPDFTYRGTQIFKADSPAGPFLPLGKELTTPKEYMALDGTFWEEDGTPYMIFCHEWVQVVDGTFELMPLKADLSAAAGDPVTLFTASQGGWTTGGGYWTDKDGTRRKSYVSDGNFVYRTKDGELLILWSSFKNGKYCVAISRSTTGKLAGPWICDPEPIFEEDGGHPMVLKDFDGNLHLVFHQPNSGHSHPVILPLEDTGRSLVIKKEDKRITPVMFSDVVISDGFWSPRLKNHKDVTLNVCIDQIENQTGRIRNFENAAKGEGEHSGIFFDDSDVYKALEGMAYSLQNNPDPVLEAKCDEWIDKFAAAQQPDGYINTFYTLTGLENRWDNMDKHEMYCAGHMIEAGVAYYNVTGKRKLLDVCIRMADHMMTVFGPGKRHWVPGHEEIELALVKLYKTTGEKKYLDFAGWLLDQRGHGYGSYGKLIDRPWPPQYYQDEVPVREMTDISGHAVRSMYLYCGMADVASFTGDRGYIAALDRLWDDVVLRNMYITGGIGQSASNEGFTEDYSLPNLSAYCETCASVGMVLWNWRMNQFTGDSKYVDVLERSMYNGALAGISLAGDRFFYVNPLESLGNHHRQAWYGCACCPSQICRFLPSIGNYIYGVSDEAVWVNLYMGNSADIKVGRKSVTLTQETNYPWEGAVALKVGVKGTLDKEIRLRVPGWCRVYTLKVNGEPFDAPVERGYAVIGRKWKDGDRIEIDFDMPVEVVAADPRVKEDEGMRAVQRGPIVYCIEEADNPTDFDGLRISEDAGFDTAFEADKLGGIVGIKARVGDRVLGYIPYYSWDNREAGKMKVWVPLAEIQ